MSNQLIPNQDFQTVVAYENGIATIRTLDPNSPNNNDLIEDYQNIDIPLQTSNNSINVDNLPLIDTLQKLLIDLQHTMIRFDGSPNFYQKSDYEQLIKTITNSLIYLYKKDQIVIDAIEYLKVNKDLAVVEFYINDNMELEQHTVFGADIDFQLQNNNLVIVDGTTPSNLGRVSINPMGAYVEGTYSRLDLVTYNGGGYISLINNNTSAPGSTDWMELISNLATIEIINGGGAE